MHLKESVYGNKVNECSEYFVWRSTDSGQKLVWLVMEVFTKDLSFLYADDSILTPESEEKFPWMYSEMEMENGM